MTVDFHVDTPWQWHKHGVYDLEQRHPTTALDIPRMKEGGLDAAFFALYLSDSEQDRLGDYESTEAIWRQIQAVARYPQMMLGLEGGRLLHKNLNQLAMYAAAGVRYLTLCHNFTNDLCDSATDAPEHDGLSRWGEQVIETCEDLNILVDVSHASDGTIESVLDWAIRPIVATHSGCSAVLNHPRNLHNHLIKRIAELGGVIGVPFARRFVGDWTGIVDHIEHICQLTGHCRTAAIGSDLDGAVLVDGMDGVQNWNSIGDELADRGYSTDNIELITGKNIMRTIGARS